MYINLAQKAVLLPIFMLFTDRLPLLDKARKTGGFFIYIVQLMARGLNLLNSMWCNVLSKAPLCLLHHMLVYPTPQTVSSLCSLHLETEKCDKAP